MEDPLFPWLQGTVGATGLFKGHPEDQPYRGDSAIKVYETIEKAGEDFAFLLFCSGLYPGIVSQSERCSGLDEAKNIPTAIGRIH